jgi:hypothetical protein
MTDLNYAIKVMLACQDGKAIQYATKSQPNDWIDVASPAWAWHDLTYRIKPDPKLTLPSGQFWVRHKDKLHIERLCLYINHDVRAIGFTSATNCDYAVHFQALTQYSWSHDRINWFPFYA